MKPALVLIDLQNDYFPGGRMEKPALEAFESKKSDEIIIEVIGKSSPVRGRCWWNLLNRFGFTAMYK
jgi:hypothetical protein